MLDFIGDKPLGKVLTGDAGVYLARDPDTVRGPDVHFVRLERWPGPAVLDDYLDIAPDLCVEVTSPTDRWTDLLEKVDQYLDKGVRIVWVIDTRLRNAHVFRLTGITSKIEADGRLSGEDVLPGFELPLTQLFKVLD
jgi:Uma2 family endonuclease